MVNLENQLDEMLEDVVRQAFSAGWVAAQRTITPFVSCAAAYRDWRGYGPGALLPGGSAASDLIRGQDAALASARVGQSPPEPPDDVDLFEAVRIAVTGPHGQHHYLSTHCLHLEHGSCKRSCKHCPAPCLCPCHAAVLEASSTPSLPKTCLTHNEPWPCPRLGSGEGCKVSHA